jgi:hypothetical protein
MLILSVLACTPTTTVGGKDSAPAAPDVSLTAAPAFDPFGGVGLTWLVEGEDAEPDASGRIVDATGAVVRKQVARETGWDGLNDAGTVAPTGSYTLVVEQAGLELEAPFAVVRAGLVAAWGEDDAGVTATRVPLYWTGRRHSQDVSDAFASVASMDSTSGPVPLPQVAESLELAGDDEADPLAYTFDSRPILTVQLGEESALGEPNLAAAQLEARLAGWTRLDEGPLVEGGTLTFQRDSALGSTLGVTEEDLAIEVSAVDDAGTTWPVQSLHVPFRAYRLLADPTWGLDGDRYQPWVSAVDPALRALEGVAPERNVVLDGLVRWIFEDAGLEYDTTYGASAYTVYAGNNWERANFDMTGFLSRKYGVVVNCTDCAGIVVGFGNMLGADVDYAIIGWNFDLNYILAIGGDTFTHCPFGRGGCGFSYHAVSTSPDNDLIWDATLALDGDDDPGSTPNTARLVQSVPEDEYLDRLAATPADYAYQAKGTIQ